MVLFSRVVWHRRLCKTSQIGIGNSRFGLSGMLLILSIITFQLSYLTSLCSSSYYIVSLAESCDTEGFVKLGNSIFGLRCVTTSVYNNLAAKLLN